MTSANKRVPKSTTRSSSKKPPARPKFAACSGSSPEVFRFPPGLDDQIARRIPPLQGRSIQVTVRPSLTAYRGKLLSGSAKGMAVHAGSFLRKRRIILDEQLLRTPLQLARIFVHEVFHFVWWKLGNELRQSFERLLTAEMRRGAPGELGWSAERLKLSITRSDIRNKSARWRSYLCESFCDTGAWAFGLTTRYAEATLPPYYRSERRAWFQAYLPAPLHV